MTSKFFKSLKKQKVQQAPEPRPLEEILKEYAQLRNQTGDIQYQIYAFKHTLDELNEQMMNLNREGGIRKKLDQEAESKAAAEAAAKEGVKNE